MLMITAYIISFIVGAMLMMCAIGLVSLCKDKEPRNKVHFFVSRDMYTNKLFLYLERSNFDGRGKYGYNRLYTIVSEGDFWIFNLNKNDYKYLKEFERREVFLNLEI